MERGMVEPQICDCIVWMCVSWGGEGLFVWAWDGVRGGEAEDCPWLAILAWLSKADINETQAAEVFKVS